MAKVARHYSMPIQDYDKYATHPEGHIVWEEGNRRILIVHIPNWLARDPRKAPKVLAFQAVHGRTYLGTFLTLENAIGVLIP